MCSLAMAGGLQVVFASLVTRREGQRHILESLAQGAEEADLLANYDGLRSEHVRAVLAYAAAMFRNNEGVATA